MEDAPTHSGPSEHIGQEATASAFPGAGSMDNPVAFSQGRGAPDAQSNFSQQQQPQQQQQQQQPPQFQQQQYGGPPQAYSPQFDMNQGHEQSRATPYNMNAMVNALPQANYVRGQFNSASQRFNQGGTSPAVVNQMPSMAQYGGGQAAMGAVPNQHYYMPQPAQMAQYYASSMSASQQQQQQQQQGNLSPRANMGFYPGQMVMNGPQGHQTAAYYYPQAGHFPAHTQAMQGQIVGGQYVAAAAVQGDPRATRHQGGDQPGSVPYMQSQDQVMAAGDSRSSVVRGPPRKPKQSGHAIWIGNLPPQTDLMSLVHHVCREAGGLESLFLISKSNCAFANFKDEPTCAAAQQKLHDSKFQSVRLVSRLRKSTVEGASGVTAPTGPAASTAQPPPPPTNETRQEQAEDESDATPLAGTIIVEPKSAVSGEATPQKDKFFILKSLTVEDLDLSVETGIWATQAHNEETLNAAFKAVDNVYLVFSANKSGEYFGYARMVSAINEDPAAAIQFAPKAQTASDVDLPKAIPTEATEFAPKGRIIDDSARGTIFWEAERDESPGDTSAGDSEEGGSTGDADDSSSVKSGQEGTEQKAWGKPFQLEWLSTTRLPFYRTRGLRNPWNSNREVKIARDGTELEPSVGRRLIGLFNRVQSPVPGALGMRQNMPMVPGYPLMRPPF